MTPIQSLLATTLCAAPTSCGVVCGDGARRRHAIELGCIAWPVRSASQTATVAGVAALDVAVLATTISSVVVVAMVRERAVCLCDDQVVTPDCLDCDLTDTHPRGAWRTQGRLP